jgi:hypothetical protein
MITLAACALGAAGAERWVSVRFVDAGEAIELSARPSPTTAGT